ncbi:hypothetical protein [Hymenobacter psychrophilus]|nr:hypothetical protein [Hymenobacter psychrophilus]
MRQTAREFGLPYLENPTFGAALRSHYRLLRRLSSPPVAAKPARRLAVHA